ncbi:MAG: hypothetical protein ACK4P3_01335 [Fimbriimonadaceae bacterium]
MSLVCALALLVAQPTTLKESLFVDGLLIGSYAGGQWVKHEKPVNATNVPARQLLLMSSIPSKPIQKVTWEDVPEGNFIDETPNPPRVLWTGAMPRYPRPIRSQNPNQAAYVQSVSSALQRVRKGTYSIQITKLIRVDLDGDGVDEVLIEARTKGRSDSQILNERRPGTFSGVFVRALVKGKVIVTPIQVDIVRNTDSLPYVNQIRAIADLTGNKRYEIITSSDYYEGQSAMVSEFRGGQVRKLVENGAGV